MENKQLHSILQSAQFKALVSKRWRFSLLLTAIMLLVYFGFILTIAFRKDLLTTKMGDHLTVGLPIGLGVILFAWALTGIYVHWANNKYDAEVENIKSKILNKK